MAGDLTNRVALNKAITVQSVNGPWVTTIRGAGASNGTTAVRCAWLTNGASLVGFRLLDGATRTSGDLGSLLSGGGVWCASSNANVANCLILSTTAAYQGGGIFQGTINNSLISSNLISTGGQGSAASSANLNSCTVVGNLGSFVPAVYSSRLTNCIVYYNANNYGQVFVTSYCCASPALSGGGNFVNPPQLFPDGIHLTSGSPCLGAGTNRTTGTDIFGRAWANPPSVGCAEWDPAPLVSQPQLSFTSDPVGFTVGKMTIASQPVFTCWWLKDGSPLQD